MFCAEKYIILNRADEAEAHLNTCISLSKKYSLANYLIPAKLMQGWVRVLRGEVEAGIRQAEAALETLKSFPSRRFHLPIRIAIVGLAKAAAGDSMARSPFSSLRSKRHRPQGSGGTNQNCFASRPRCCSRSQSNARLRQNNA